MTCPALCQPRGLAIIHAECACCCALNGRFLTWHSDISTAKPGAALAKESCSDHMAVDMARSHSDDTALSSNDSGKRQSSDEASPEDEGAEGGKAAASAAKLNVGTSTNKSTLPFDQL